MNSSLVIAGIRLLAVWEAINLKNKDIQTNLRFYNVDHLQFLTVRLGVPSII